MRLTRRVVWTCLGLVVALLLLATVDDLTEVAPTSASVAADASSLAQHARAILLWYWAAALVGGVGARLSVEQRHPRGPWALWIAATIAVVAVARDPAWLVAPTPAAFVIPLTPLVPLLLVAVAAVGSRAPEQPEEPVPLEPARRRSRHRRP